MPFEPCGGTFGGARLCRAVTADGGGASAVEHFRKRWWRDDARLARLAASEMGLDGVSPHQNVTPSKFSEISLTSCIDSRLVRVAVQKHFRRPQESPLRTLEKNQTERMDSAGQAREIGADYSFQQRAPDFVSTRLPSARKRFKFCLGGGSDVVVDRTVLWLLAEPTALGGTLRDQRSVE